MADERVEHVSFSVRVPLWIVALGVATFLVLAGLLVLLGALVG